MKMCNFDKIKEQIDTVKGTTFGGLTTVTEVKLKGGKKNLMQGRVTKRTVGSNIMLFSNTKDSGYVSMVKRRMVNEGKDPDTFEVKPRAWGTRVGNSPFIEHKDKKYLECFFISPGKSTYFLDGVEIDKDDIEGLDVKNTDTQAHVESQGGIEDKVVIRTFSLDSIESVTITGKEIN
jgi:hypothetical protein